MKLHLASGGYCALLIGLNWFWAVDYDRAFGVQSEAVAPFPLAVLLSAGIALYLAVLCFGAARKRREGLRPVRWIESWTVGLYALPLLWRWRGGSSWREPDGALATATAGYGHEASTVVFVLALLGLLLFQVLVRLSGDDDGLRAA